MAVDYAALKKGGFMRQKQKNNFSLRLQVVGGNLTAENLVKIAEVAEKYGDGHVHLTSRQSVEIPFIKIDDVDEVKEELAKGGCKPGVCGPRVRTITACQGNQICPGGNIDSYDIAKKLDSRYYARELPHKFKFGVTGCQNNCLKAEENDVGIKGAAIVSWKQDACINCGVCEKACREGSGAGEQGGGTRHARPRYRGRGRGAQGHRRRIPRGQVRRHGLLQHAERDLRHPHAGRHSGRQLQEFLMYEPYSRAKEVWP